MGIFAKSEQSEQIVSSTETSVITKNSKFNGDIELECNIHIDGEFSGKIKSKSSVVIGKTGNLNCDIFANKVIVSGNMKGNIEAESVEILQGGRVFGKVISNNLVIQKDGIFDGESKRKSQKEEPKPSNNKELKKEDKPKKD